MLALVAFVAAANGPLGGGGRRQMCCKSFVDMEFYEVRECSYAENMIVECDEEDGAWVRAKRVGSVNSVVGLPDAVGRLRNGVIDKLDISFPKEDHDRAGKALGTVVDKLLEIYMKDNSFVDLKASATPHTAPVLERRGFSPLENPDLTALSRNEPIVTHRAVLESAVGAYRGGLGDRSDVILQLLLDDNHSSQSQQQDKEVKESDPWKGIGTTFF